MTVKLSKKTLLSLDYFIAGVPPGPLFKMSFDDLAQMTNLKVDESINQNTVTEVCLIALVAYFEAFFKNEFAAIVNICPQVLKYFCSKRSDISIQVKDLLAVDLDSTNRLGFVLAEKYDFGSAKTINSLFFDLLSITLFSKDESMKYDRLLNDRNLLVHHAGIYTMRYHEQNFSRQQVGNRIFFDSLIVSKGDYLKWAAFTDHMVAKTISTCFRALAEVVQRDKVKLVKERRGAYKFLAWYEK
jgi:hypothetical protein